MHLCCAHETPLYLRLCVRQSVNSVQESQLVLEKKYTFLVLVLGFYIIATYRQDKDCVVPDFHILHLRLLDFRFLQMQKLAVVGDPSARLNKAAFASGLSPIHPGGLTVCRQSLRVDHLSTSA